MAKKFNVFIYYLSSFICFIDFELCFKFNDNKNRDSGLPEELEQLTKEKKYEVNARIRSFKQKVRNKQKATLGLTAEDINHLKINGYEYYSQLTEKYKAFTKINFYEIKDDRLISKDIINLFFLREKYGATKNVFIFGLKMEK